MNPLPVTTLAGALLGLIFIALTVNVVRNRYRAGLSLGVEAPQIRPGAEASAPPLFIATRSHGNFVEWVPLSLLLLGLLEVAGGARWLVAALAAMLVLGRLLHPFGMGRPVPNPFRGGGVALNMTMLAVTIPALLWAALV